MPPQGRDCLRSHLRPLRGFVPQLRHRPLMLTYGDDRQAEVDTHSLKMSTRPAAAYLEDSIRDDEPKGS